jgi:SAM-dependent methyltransferase
MTNATAITDVEAWNDALAREHDIDDYYERSGPIIRLFERRRLAHIRRLLAPSPQDRVLEVGCGGGHVLRLFPECQLTGVDVSGEMLRKARQNLRGLDVRLLKGELDEVEVEPCSYDGIVCSEVLEHVIDPESILEQMQLLLAPGGRAVVTIPNDHLINTLKACVRFSGLSRVPPFRRVSWGGDRYHLHVWRAAQMRALLSRYFHVAAMRFAPSRALPVRLCYLCTSRDD